MQLFTEPLISEDLKGDRMYVDKGAIKQGNGLKILLSRDEFARNLNSIIQENHNIKLANLFRFPAPIIEKYAYKKITENLLRRFSVRVGFGKEQFYVETESGVTGKMQENEIGSDFNNSFFLFFDDIPLVIISFTTNMYDLFQCLGITNSNGIIDIKQIQGIKGEIKFDLNSFDWRKAIIEIVEKIIKYLGYSHIGISSASSNFWLGDNLKKCKKGGEYYNMYDQVAIDMGYTRNSDLPIYIKSL